MSVQAEVGFHHHNHKAAMTADGTNAIALKEGRCSKHHDVQIVFRKGWSKKVIPCHVCEAERKRKMYASHPSSAPTGTPTGLAGTQAGVEPTALRLPPSGAQKPMTKRHKPQKKLPEPKEDPNLADIVKRFTSVGYRASLATKLAGVGFTSPDEVENGSREGLLELKEQLNLNMGEKFSFEKRLLSEKTPATEGAEEEVKGEVDHEAVQSFANAGFKYSLASKLVAMGFEDPNEVLQADEGLFEELMQSMPDLTQPEKFSLRKISSHRGSLKLQTEETNEGATDEGATQSKKMESTPGAEETHARELKEFTQFGVRKTLALVLITQGFNSPSEVTSLDMETRESVLKYIEENSLLSLPDKLCYRKLWLPKTPAKIKKTVYGKLDGIYIGSGQMWGSNWFWGFHQAQDYEARVTVRYPRVSYFIKYGIKEVITESWVTTTEEYGPMMLDSMQWKDTKGTDTLMLSNIRFYEDKLTCEVRVQGKVTEGATTGFTFETNKYKDGHKVLCNKTPNSQETAHKAMAHLFK